ncbi:fibrocystin-L-like [Chiloscyllium plagiosum]|uniref:fibrocystin-L-like n=1 Tax=Chiloscyllium plagiosum TaxID=36176 RepID=UPI001CB83753|nr:fibrocystin-L-like [Chiloscyllium plagiosum]
MKGQSVQWGVAIVLSLWSLTNAVSQSAPIVSDITPYHGSINGATRLTIKGKGFLKPRPFDYTGGNGQLGNKVQLLSETRSIPCDVEKDSSHETQVICYTRPLPKDSYQVVVSVDGVPINANKMMVFKSEDHYTPTIERISPLSGLPGQLINISGDIFTNIYGSNKPIDSNLRKTRILRVYAGGMFCDLLQPDSDTLYGLKLDNVYSDSGMMTCKMMGTYVGHHNVSFILDNGHGRSLPNLNTYFISSLNKLSMFQTYAEVTGIYPSDGSVEGGTLLTVTGRFFDETDAPARVTVGGQSCEVQSVSTTQIICQTPKEACHLRTVFPGGRGLKIETWQGGNLDDLPDYNENTPGYSVSWTDEALVPASTSQSPSVTRLSGFFVAPETDNYRFYINKCGSFQLYFSLTGIPQDKVNIASRPQNLRRYGNQEFDTMHLQKGKAYYIELVLQKKTSSSFSIGMYRENISYMEQQTADSVNEVQLIKSHSHILLEKQILALENWNIRRAISEVQEIIISSSCQKTSTCSYIWYRLIYNQDRTVLIPMDANAAKVQQALNDLWTIKPDKVQVSRKSTNKNIIYKVTFISTRGDFDLLQYEIQSGYDVTIEVVERTKGKPKMDTFTLMLDGISSTPISHKASVTEVKAALEGMLDVKCPDHIVNYRKGYTVYYFNNFEDDISKNIFQGGQVTMKTNAFCGRYCVKNPTSLFGFASYHQPFSLRTYRELCFAYKGHLRNNFRLSFTYQVDDERKAKNLWFPYRFVQDNQWTYTCINLYELVISKVPRGTRFLLKAIHMRTARDQDFFVDTVYIGQRPTVQNQDGIVILYFKPERDVPIVAYPPLFDKGILIEEFLVTEERTKKDGMHSQYEVTMVTIDCGCNIPLLEIAFAQALPNGTKDEMVYRGSTWPQGAVLRVSRTQAASPPISGTLDIEYFGKTLKDLPVNATASEMQYALQTISEIGTVSVTKSGNCSAAEWTVKWLSKPGNQPTLKINDLNVFGVNATAKVHNKQQGGLFSEHLIGDLFRTPHTLPQVKVFINGIPSKCSGNCGYKWKAEKTPTISRITPTTGSRSSGTVLTITGFGFANSSMTDTTWVSIGGTHCPITGLTDTEITCMIGVASNTSSPLIVYIAGLGFANYSSNQAYTFTFQFEATSIYPSIGSTEGGTILTISGYGFVPNSMVLIGGKTCLQLTESPVKMKCRTPEAPPGMYNISVIAAGISNLVPFSFIYIDAKIPVISEVIPKTSSVAGGSNLTIYGSDFGNKSEDSFVVIGNSECAILRWSTNNITCCPPSLPPANYSIYVQTRVGKSLNASVEYVLRVTEVTPQQGSLYGGTKITISGSGFSPVPEDNIVQIGSVPCHITFASPNILKCVSDQTGRKFVITNNGSSGTIGVGYEWNPSTLDIVVGDTVQWQWQSPPLLQNLRYRVFSVSKPSGVNYKGSGFISGNVSTSSGSFSYHFTSPGTYYYSSGYVDQKQSIILQGTVNVKPAEERIESVHIYLAGIEAEYVPGPSEKLPSQQKRDSDCTAPIPTCNQTLNRTDDKSFTFYLSACYSPTINSITPSKGTVKDKLTITGTGFSKIGCANEVRVGIHPCVVESSTENELLCQIDPEGAMDIGIAALVSVTVHNLGTAINTVTNELSRRFVLLPHIDDVSPNVGSTMGKTRVTITGSGFGADLSAVRVQLANVLCTLVSANCTHVICDSSASIASTGIVTLSVHGIPAVCSGTCDYSYTESAAPIILNVSSTLLTTVYTELTISGSGFGNSVDEAFVHIGNASFVPNDVSDISMNCTVGPVPVGKHTLRVLTLSKGLSLRGISITSAARASLSPASGGIHGGTTLLITGNGFIQDETIVMVHRSPCHLLSVTPGEVKCITPAGPPGTVDVKITVRSTMYPVLNFTYNQTETPEVLAVSPVTGVSESTITIIGSGFGSSASNITVSIDNVLCKVTMMNDSCVQCIVGHHAGGTFPIFLKHERWGYALSDLSFQYELNINSIFPTEGSFGGGALLTITGIGFDQEKSKVFVCDGECKKMPSASTSRILYCQVPLHNGTDPELACDVVVVNGNDSSKVSNGFTYLSALTPVITTINPRRGGTGGGTKLTITGSGFCSDISENNVIIAETPCEIQSVNETNIVCVTGAHFPSQQTKVIVNVRGNGIAKLDNADFNYIDVWSSRYTWGGDTPPEAGSLVVITRGQTILLDQSTPVLKMLVIQGGTLVFDEADIELQTENILITDGGVFQIGTESAPFRHKAIITLHGHLRAKELPLYGAKTLAVREGTLDLHGLPVPVVWTHLAQTAKAGSSNLILQKAVTWKPGDKIVIASTGDSHSQRENEVRIIEAVSDDGRILYLTEPLMYQHLGVSIPLPDGVVFEARAEVGLLTRNIVVRGSNQVEWNDRIEACPEGFNTGTSIVPYMPTCSIYKCGWMALFPNDEILNWHFKDMDHITNISYKAIFHHFKDNDSIVLSHKFIHQPDYFKIMNPVRNNSLQPLSWASNQNGDWYFDQENLTLYYLISGRGVSERHSFHSNLDPTMVDIDVQFQVFRCFYENCEPPSRYTEINASNYVTWSNSSFWESRPESNYTVPTEGSSVVIEQGIWIVVDSPIPPLYNLTILGTLEIRDDNLKSFNRSSSYSRIVLNATYISIQGGRLIAGSPEKPFQGELQIVLMGDHSTPEWPLRNGPNQGSKVLGVFGGLDLHGIPHLVYKTKLGSTAHAGSLNITLVEAVDWQEGDEIFVSTTSYNYTQTEIRTIHSISFDRKTLGLNEALSYTHVAETQELKGRGQSYTLAADIGLLSRNIKIIGHNHPDKADELFGARVLISSFFHNGMEFKGNARIQDVEFYHSGQYGYLSYFGPRYSVSFLNLGEIVENESYIRGCAFHHGFTAAIGVFATSGLNIDDNVIFKTYDGGITLMGDRNRVRRNLVALTLRSSLSDAWAAAIEIIEGSDIVLQGNIVAGFKKAGYRINGEPCPKHSNPDEAWFNNEAHGGQYGIYMNRNGFPTCSLIQGFTIWKCWEYGIYFQTEGSIQISNVTLMENKLSIFSMIYGSSASGPRISSKRILISNALLVGISPISNCSDLQPDDSILSHKKVDRNGIYWPTFASAGNNAPYMPHDSLTSYPAIGGQMIIENTTFVGFKGTCSNKLNVMFITNPKNEDFQHPILVKGITIVDSEERGKVFIHRPNVAKVNPADCVDMVCDAKKKTLLKDLDGSFLGAVGAVVPQSEYEWDGDRRYGTGDYRIPKTMLTHLNGNRIPVSQIAPHKGIIRDSTCTYMPDWQSYKCFGLNYEILVIESLDPDSETRRLSPVALLTEGYVDLINGPQDHGWCSSYACNKRASIFHAVVATNKPYELYFTGVSPQNLRIILLNADDSKVIRLAIYYSTSQRLDVYVNNTFVPPTNAKWNADKTDFTLKGPTYAGEFTPKLDSSVIGENYFDRTYQMLNVLVRGSTPIEVHTAPVLHISFNLPAMTVDEFYGPNLVENLALFLNVPQSKIRITNIVRETGLRRKRATGITVEVEIRDPPSEHFSVDNSNSTNTTSTEGKLKFSDLEEIASNLGEAMLTGNLSASLAFTISTMDLSSPVPPPGDAEWAQMTSKPVLSRAVRTNHVAAVTGLVVVREPVAGQTGQLLNQQPSVKAVDDAGNCVSVGVTSWELVAVLLNSQNVTVTGLNGTTSILFKDCWANYTDLSINTNGTSYKLVFELRSIKTYSGTFSVKQINDSPGKPSGPSPSLALGNTQGIIGGSIVGGLVLILLIAGITWKLTAGNTRKIQVSGMPETQEKKQADTVAGHKPGHSLPPVQN